MKQKDLAEQINMTEQHISHIENAYSKLSLPTLVAIANALSVDCNSLLGEVLTGARTSVLAKKIEEMVSAMNEQQLRFCVEFCRLLIKFGP